jgi:hypothetical protein
MLQAEQGGRSQGGVGEDHMHGIKGGPSTDKQSKPMQTQGDEHIGDHKSSEQHKVVEQ